MSLQLRPSKQITKFGNIGNRTEIIKAIEHLFNYSAIMVHFRRGCNPVPMNKVTEHLFIYQWGRVLTERYELVNLHGSKNKVKLKYSPLIFQPSDVDTKLINHIKNDSNYYDTLQKLNIEKHRDELIKQGKEEHNKREAKREAKLDSLTIWNDEYEL